MILLVCSCLNIRVHGRGNNFNLEDISNLHLPENVVNDSFFESQVYPVTLDLAGVTVSQKVLCKVRHIENWTVTTCTCCTMDVFSRQIDDNDIVFVSPKAETNESYISSLMESNRYSSLFKLILPDINDNFIQNNIGVEIQNGNFDSSLDYVRTQVSNYLKVEQRAMEERIRQFTEEQQSNYNNLLQKVQKNKQAMVYLMIQCKESQNQTEEDVVSESLAKSPSVQNKDLAHDFTSTDSVFDKRETKDLGTDIAVKPQKLKVLEKTGMNLVCSKTKVKSEMKHEPANIDVGGVFDMEEFETKESYSYDSDERTDDSENEISVDTVEESSEGFLCAKSLPMSIPTLSNYPHFSLHEEKDSSPKAPEDIAASMRALACSVQDGTEMFGELPRRRLNTGELLAFRPI